jgi:hypothetical protein
MPVRGLQANSLRYCPSRDTLSGTPDSGQAAKRDSFVGVVGIGSSNHGGQLDSEFAVWLRHASRTLAHVATWRGYGVSYRLAGRVSAGALRVMTRHDPLPVSL